MRECGTFMDSRNNGNVRSIVNKTRKSRRSVVTNFNYGNFRKYGNVRSIVNKTRKRRRCHGQFYGNECKASYVTDVPSLLY